MRGHRWLTLLALAALPANAEPRFSEPRALAGPRLDGAVLDLAFVADDRVLVLSTGGLALLRVADAALEPLARRSLPGPLRPVRFPGGRLLPDSAGGAAWVLTSQMERARLFALDAGLALRADADALPWPGAPRGLRYRLGTNLLEGSLGPLGGGPFLAVAGRPGLALGPDGTPVGPAQAPALGPPLEAPWPDLVVTTGAHGPQQTDELVAVEVAAAAWTVRARRALPGPIRALGSRRDGDQAHLLVAAETAAGLDFTTLRLLRAP